MAALLHHGYASPHLDGLVDVVGHEQHGHAQRAVQSEKLVLQTFAHDRIDRAERLVHEHDRRLDGHCPSNAYALTLAARELRGIAVAHAGWIEPDQLEQLLDTLLDALTRPAQQARHGGHVLGDGLVRKQADLLDHVADAPPQGAHLDGHDVFAVDEHLAAAGLDQAVDHLQAGRLAAAARADQHADLAGRDQQRQIDDRALRSVLLADVAELDRCLGHQRARRSPARTGTLRRLSGGASGHTQRAS